MTHPTALVESEEVGEGTSIWAFVHILEGAVIGRKCKFGDHAFVESGAVIGDRVTVKNNALIWHGVTIGNDVFIGPNVVFTNDLRPRAHGDFHLEDVVRTAVGDGASIGANATVICGITLAEHSMIGAGSVVAADVRSHELVAGNPARHVGWVCYCGNRLDDDFECRVCERRYTRGESGLKEVGDDH